MLQQSNGTTGPFPGDAYDGDIAIVGLACRFAGARDAREYWSNLRAGVESVVPYSDAALIEAGVDPGLLKRPDYVKAGAALPDMECFDAALFGLSPRDAAIMDPQHRHFLQCAWAAFEDAGYDPGAFAGAVGVFAGSGHNAYLHYNLLGNRRLVREVGLFLLRHTGNDKDFLTTRLSYLLDLKGPSVSVQTACSTSLVAVHMAAQSLLNGECDMALAGGVSIDLPHGQGYLYQEGEILAPDGHCRAFDAKAQGTVFGSGVGAVILRRLADAIDDRDHIYAVIKGSAVNNDGAGKVGYLAPGVDGQAHAIIEALGVAGTDARTIGYVEAHGTGTPVGDPIEIAALTQAYRQDTRDTGYCAIGSVKPNIGHTDTAAGVASLIKVALSLEQGEIPPSLHHERDNPACDFARTPFFVNAALHPWPRRAGAPRRAGINALGVGGTNAHVVLEEAPVVADRRAPSRPRQLIALSASSSTALDANCAALATYLESHPDTELADAAYTLTTGRRHLPHRRILVAADAHEAAGLLRDRPAERVFTSSCTVPGRPVAFLFAGGGAQHVGMARELYASETIFADAINECFATLARCHDTDFRALLYPEPEAVRHAMQAIEQPSVALPLLFAIQVALTRLWADWGVRPASMIGHSMGEYVAAHLSGVFGLEDALRIVSERGRLFETLPPGAMLSVPLDEAALRALLPAELSVAAINGRSLTVASGPASSIEQLRTTLAEREIEARQIPISVAAHSPMLDPILDEFRAFLHTVKFSTPRLPFVSNLTGEWIRAEEASDPEYWVRHLREPVRFTDGLSCLLEERDIILLEVGPGRVLSGLVRQHAGHAAAGSIFNSLPHPDDPTSDLDHMLAVAGRLWATGAPVDWHGYWRRERRNRIPLPSYRFDTRRHWIEPAATDLREQPDPDEPLERRPDPADWLFEPIWSRRSALPIDTAGKTALIFADRAGLGDALASRLRARGRDVALVRPGKRFHICKTGEFTLAPGNPGDYRALVAHLAARGRMPDDICHLWLVTGNRRRRTFPRADAATQELGLHSLLHLAQALGENDPEGALRLLAVSDGMQRVADEPVPFPEKATVLGLVRVIPREFPNIRARSIDIAPSQSPALCGRLADLLVAELGMSDEAEAVAYRALERWVQTFEPAHSPASTGCDILPNGIYLITGGLGGIGLTLARHLGERFGARLALVGRSPLPARTEWAGLLAALPLDDPRSLKLRQLLAIEAAGGRVLYITADVCDAGAMRSVVRTVRRQFGPINGVFHTAGCLDDGVVQLKTPAAVNAVLAPKLRGTFALERALVRERPDFLMLFSSVSAFAGLPGQVDYAAANAFLDAFAQSRSRDGYMRVVSVGWSQWREVGMAAALARPSEAEPGPLPTESATPIDHPLLTEGHRLSDDSHVFSGLLSPDTHWLLDEHRLASGQALIPGTGFLELVRAAYSTIAGDSAVLHDTVFLAPFAVADGATHAIQVHLDRRNGTEWTFRILGRALDQESEPGWLEHVRGVIGALEADVPPAIDLAAIAARCIKDAIPVAAIRNPPNLRFGPRWQNVDSAQRGVGEALIALRLPEAFRDDLRSMALHPALLDLATAGAQALIPGNGAQDGFFVPASYGYLRLHAPLTDSIVSHIRLRADSEGNDALAVFDVVISDPAGKVLVEINEFTMLRLGNTSALRRPGSPPAPPKPIATANNLIHSGLANGLLPIEGMQLIERILEERTGAHIVVSPLDLMPAIARLRASRPARGPSSETHSGMPAETAPRTEAEYLIAQLWGDMLGIEQVGRADDFFDLGGHSLLAVQFVNRLRKRTGKTIPLGALMEASTVAGLAALLDPESPALASGPTGTELPTSAIPPPSSVLPGVMRIRAGGGQLALFLVHDGLGETLLYRNLAFKLDGGHSIYGLEPERREDGQYRHADIVEMAAGQVERVRAIQPNGPYLVAGLCAGGVIAFEMARQLEDAGETVAFVGIIDAADVEAAEQPFHIARSRIQRIRALLGMDGTPGDAPRRALLPLIAIILRKGVNLLLYEVGSRIARHRQRREVDRLRTTASASEAAPSRDLGFLELYEVAHRRHRPQGLFAGGDVVLFKATAGNGADNDIPFSEFYSDHILGWGKRVAEDVVMIPIPGGHTSMLQEPHVAVLAAAMQDRIRMALAQHQFPDDGPGSLPEQPIPLDHEPTMAAEAMP